MIQNEHATCDFTWFHIAAASCQGCFGRQTSGIYFSARNIRRRSRAQRVVRMKFHFHKLSHHHANAIIETHENGWLWQMKKPKTRTSPPLFEVERKHEFILKQKMRTNHRSILCWSSSSSRILYPLSSVDSFKAYEYLVISAQSITERRHFVFVDLFLDTKFTRARRFIS